MFSEAGKTPEAQDEFQAKAERAFENKHFRNPQQAKKDFVSMLEQMEK